MNPSTRFIVPPTVLARGVGAETVILDLVSGTYFGLDPIGARIWQLMVEGRTLADICDTIEAEYEASRPDIERDMVKLVEDLLAQSLIRTSFPGD